MNLFHVPDYAIFVGQDYKRKRRMEEGKREREEGRKMAVRKRGRERERRQLLGSYTSFLEEII